MAKKLWVLHYGGQTFETEDSTILDDVPGMTETGTVGFRLADDRWIKLVLGPGIPVALEEKKAPGRVRAIR